MSNKAAVIHEKGTPDGFFGTAPFSCRQKMVKKTGTASGRP